VIESCESVELSQTGLKVDKSFESLGVLAVLCSASRGEWCESLDAAVERA